MSDFLVGIFFAGSCGCKMGNAHVDSNSFGFIDWSGKRIFNFYLAGKNNIPGTSFLNDGGFLDPALKLSGFAEFDPADFGKIGLRSFDFNSLGITEAISDASFFKFGITGLFSFFQAAKEMFVGIVEVFESLLRNLAVDFLEPKCFWEFLEDGELVVLFIIGKCFSLGLVSFSSEL
jgi:hypothetical protein